MKCQYCNATLATDEWGRCPMCFTPLAGFRDDMMDVVVDGLLRDTQAIVKKLHALSARIYQMREFPHDVDKNEAIK